MRNLFKILIMKWERWERPFRFISSNFIQISRTLFFPKGHFWMPMVTDKFYLIENSETDEGQALGWIDFCNRRKRAHLFTVARPLKRFLIASPSFFFLPPKNTKTKKNSRKKLNLQFGKLQKKLNFHHKTQIIKGVALFIAFLITNIFLM